jgi:nucleoside-diphosphate-sugar epimerase
MQSISIIGCGYTGLALARRWRARGAPVAGFATRRESLAAIDAAGAQSHALDLDRATQPLNLGGHIVYYSVPPAPAGAGDARLLRFLDGIAGSPARVVYFSTTGVYGDQAGAPVDEETPVNPGSARASRRVAAERQLRAWAIEHAISWCILRIAGIYGPGRLPLARLQRGEPAIVPAQALPGNRIHVDDLVEASIAAGTSGRANGRIYNVSDGKHDSLTVYLQRVADIAGVAPPPLVGRAEAQHLSGESRRIVNRRMIDELGVVLAYPDMDQGIRASLAAG